MAKAEGATRLFVVGERRIAGCTPGAGWARPLIEKFEFVKYTSEHTGIFVWCVVEREPVSGPPWPSQTLCEVNPMEYKGVEYSVVQLVDGTGWRWEINFGDGKSKAGVTQAGRAAAIKMAEYEIDRVLKDKK